MLNSINLKKIVNMKKYNIIVIFILLFAIGLTNCKKDTKDVSRVTTYAVMTIIGGADTVIAVGSNWVDPGINVSTGDPYTISGTVNTAVKGRYVLTYKATNKDGFPSTAVRVVWVVGVTGDGTVNYAKAYEGGRGTSYSNEKGDGTVILKATSIPGVYYCTDMFARYYEVWRGYGITYRCPGVIRVNSDKTFDNAEIDWDSPWGASFITAGSGSIDNAGKFTYKCTIGGTPVATAFFLEPKP